MPETPANHASARTLVTRATWEAELIPLLLIAIRLRDDRITRLEQLDRQKAAALDEMRRHIA